MSERIDQILAYHQQSKHHLQAFARGPGRLDWATQPDPFRRYLGAPVLPLDLLDTDGGPSYASTFRPGHIPPAPLDRAAISRLFFDSLALSAWKQANGARWSLRVNPSSGNLHPTEAYLVGGPLEGLSSLPLVAHYAPREHALERRATFSLETWRSLSAALPRQSLLLGLSSIHWREAWKYGERAYRYCQHDVGHALAAISVAAAGLGWQTRLLDDLGTEDLGLLLGASEHRGIEREHPDCLLAVYPQGEDCTAYSLPREVVAPFAAISWQGQPNRLSPGHVHWQAIDWAAQAAGKPATSDVYAGIPAAAGLPALPAAGAEISLRRVVHQRRSAVNMDGLTHIPQDAFYAILSRTLAGPGRIPFSTLPWDPRVHLVLFVHRVEGLPAGLYLLLRDPAQVERLRAALRADFSWKKPPACPAGLEFYRLLDGDVRRLAQQLSCGQGIAADGCFSVGMLADFERSLDEFGPWFYPRLFWECGMIGQVLYLEAEVAGIRGTGIGCFFDDVVHHLLGLEGRSYQSLYHFTVGGPRPDPRVTTLPAYHHLER